MELVPPPQLFRVAREAAVQSRPKNMNILAGAAHLLTRDRIVPRSVINTSSGDSTRM